MALTICFAASFMLLQLGAEGGAKLSDAEAAGVWGGQYCPTFVHLAVGVACTSGAVDTCQLNAAETGCIGGCPFTCDPEDSWFGGGTVRGEQGPQTTCPSTVREGCDYLNPENDPPSCFCNPFNPQGQACYPKFYPWEDCDV